MLCMQDGSSESFKELLEGIMSPSSLIDFDTNIFQAALVGKRNVMAVACVSVLALQADHYVDAALLAVVLSWAAREKRVRHNDPVN